MRYIVTTPWWLRTIYPKGLIWDLKTDEPVLYLTFDDGPHPVATPFVLDELKKYNAKATFFCIGKNVQQYPDIYKRILMEGHRVGNHTQNHLNAWKRTDEQWIEDVKEAAKWIDSDLFRPPYGRLKNFPAQVLLTAKKPFKIIMWDVLSADFDESKTADECFAYIKKNVRKGSIIVFHDSQKAWSRLQNSLKKTLQTYTDKGFRFELIR